MNSAVQQYSLSRYCPLLLAAILMLLKLTGSERMTDGGDTISKKEPQGNTDSTTKMQLANVELGSWDKPMQHLPFMNLQLTDDYGDARSRNTQIKLNNIENVDLQPVENFYKLLKLCIESQECSRN